MGMSASQARFLTLTARKTNVEFEGQQINQQRTTLSNESANYYSQLSSLAVPIPPSTEDYTRITYTFEDGSEKNTVTSIVATSNTKKTGVYMLNYVQEIPANDMVVNGTSVISNKAQATGKKYNSTGTGNGSNSDTGSTYAIGTTILQYSIGSKKGDTTVAVPELSDEKLSDRDKYIARFIDAGIPEVVASQYSDSEIVNKLKVENEYRTLAEGKYGQKDWLVRYVVNTSTGNYEPVLYNLAEVKNTDYNERTTLSLTGIRAYMFGESTESQEIKNAYAKVEKDISGRYKSLYIYDANPITSEGNINPDVHGTQYQLATITETDDNAYNDAMNQYLYEKTVYDKQIEEINAKIGVIQVQDKNLELKLKQLDTEENAISTEMDAVKKVISKNVESSFKTFNA